MESLNLRVPAYAPTYLWKGVSELFGRVMTAAKRHKKMKGGFADRNEQVKFCRERDCQQAQMQVLYRRI